MSAIKFAVQYARPYPSQRLDTEQRFKVKKSAAFSEKRSGSMAPNFPKGVVSENIVLSNRCVTENQDSEGRFDNTKFSEGCRFKKFVL